MKRNALLSTICSLALIGCATYTGIKPIYPPGHRFGGIPKTVDSLTPTLRWEPSPEPNATYDLIIYESIGEYSFWKSETRGVPGQEAYYREGLQETVHEIEEPLKPDTEYQWSVRVRRGTKVSDWSLYHINGNYNLHFIFRTPEKPEDAHR